MSSGYLKRALPRRVPALGPGIAISREAMRRSKGDVIFDQDSPETKFVIVIPRPEE